tara:strand:- start:351 stop:545 length:195 start_codon:yes stop_codon:yes gene_type:complete
MTLSLEKIEQTFKDKEENLTSEDIEKIRILYNDLDLEERNLIGYFEEIISQIQITPRNDEVIEN